MKKINLLLTSLTLFGLLSFSGCGSNKDSSNSSSTIEVERVTYEVIVKTIGNRRLNGVTVELHKGEQLVASGVTNFIGKAMIEAPIDQYKVVLKDLPSGVYVANDLEIKEVKDQYTFECMTEVIKEEKPENKVYKDGDIMYDFTVTDSDGNDFTLSESFENGKSLVLINFWATYCNPCKQEFPHIENAYYDYKDDMDIIALSVYAPDTNDVINEYKARNGLTFRMGRDINAEMYLSFSFAGYIPATVLVNKYGEIVYMAEDVFTAESLTELIDLNLSN